MKAWKIALISAASTIAGIAFGITISNGISKELDKIFLGNLSDELPDSKN